MEINETDIEIIGNKYETMKLMFNMFEKHLTDDDKKRRIELLQRNLDWLDDTEEFMKDMNYLDSISVICDIVTIAGSSIEDDVLFIEYLYYLLHGLANIVSSRENMKELQKECNSADK